MAQVADTVNLPTLPAGLQQDEPRGDDIEYKTQWFRNTYTQATILGLASFCSPGIWGAMANLGAGGLQSASTGNAATSATFCLMVVTALIGPALLGKIGPRYSLIIGTLGYAPYAAGLYCNSKYGNQWFVIVGAALCGVTAGIFWATEGAAVIAYPEPSRRGKAVAIWFSINQVGSVIGGAINLALNVNADAIGGISVNTYAVFIAIQCVSPLVAAFLSNPSQVTRKDGRKPVMPVNKFGFWQEIRDTLRLLTIPRNLVFALPFFMSQWGSGSTSFYLTTYFTVRSRALTTLVQALMNQFVIFAFGQFLDTPRLRIRTRIMGSAAILAVGLGAFWIWFFVNQWNYSRATTRPEFDWITPGFGVAWVPILGLSLFNQVLYNWLFWIVSYLAAGAEQSRMIAVMRSVESVSSAVNYGLGASSLPVVNLAAGNLAVYGVALYPLYKLVKYCSDREEAGLNIVNYESDKANALVEEDKRDL